MKYIGKMKAISYINSSRDYLDYIEEHVMNVAKAFAELSDKCKHMHWVTDDYSWNLVRSEVEWHDISKLDKEEFCQYRDSFYPVKEGDKENSGFAEAWENHKNLNHHHHETADNYIDIIHMVIDWTAMGYKFGDTAEEYYEANKDKIVFKELALKNFMLGIFEEIRK